MPSVPLTSPPAAVGWLRPRPDRCTPGNDPVPIVRVWEVGRARRSFWTGAGNLAFTGVRSPDLLVRSELI
jgi:hypothetical protein